MGERATNPLATSPAKQGMAEGGRPDDGRARKALSQLSSQQKQTSASCRI